MWLLTGVKGRGKNMGEYVLNVAIEAAIVTIRISDVVTRKAGFSYHDRSVLVDRVVVFLTQHHS